MSARSNPPSFVLMEKDSGRVVYTKRATGVGSEAISACVKKGRELAAKTQRVYTVFLALRTHRIGEILNVPMIYHLGITEEIGPQGSAMPSGRRCCSAPDVRPEGQGMECMNCRHWEALPRTNPRRVRRNVFTFNNPGAAQRILAENFVKGANSGAAGSLYIHGNRIYSYGPHFPIAQRNDADGTILIRHPSKKAPSKTTAGHISLVVAAARQAYAPDSILYDTADVLRGEAKGPAAYSNPPKVRKNVFVFNNPSRPHLNDLERLAIAAGLAVATWAPGDGQTRYRFFLAKGGSIHADYHQGDGLYTALGRKDALAFIGAYGKGRGARTNPSRAARTFISSEIGHLRRKGYPRARAAAAAYSMARRKGFRVNGACNNPTHVANPPNGSVRSYRVPSGLDAKVASMLRSAFIWAQARDGAVLTIARPEIVKRAVDYVRSGKPLPNPLLQTVFAAANPPVSVAWSSMTTAQRLELLELVGYDGGYMAYRRWAQLPPSIQNDLEAHWYDTSAPRRGGTTKRRRSPVAVNPLTRKEAGHQLRRARGALTSGAYAASKGYGETATYHAGRAVGISQVVREAGPKRQGTGASKIIGRAQVLRNPGTLRLPKPGTRLTVSEALDLAQRIGDRGLIEQCQKALKLQKAANKNAKCVIWKTFAMGSKDKIDSVVALTHYGDSPETMYKPPKGSKKGQHMYRHRWSEGKRVKKPVPVLVTPDGKTMMMPLGPGQKITDWMRG